MQNAKHISSVSDMAIKYALTPGGPDDKTDTEDDKKYPKYPDPPAPVERQLSQYFDSKYTPNQLKELAETAFDENFDHENNGDIDRTEFTNSILNLGFVGDIDRIERLFTLISSTDGDASSTYIDKENFSDFILQSYDDNPTLQEYKEQLLAAISPKFKCKHSDVQSAHRSFILSDKEMCAMKQSLESMVITELTHIEADSQFQEELIKRKTTTQNGIFCDEINAEHWDKYEVAYWVGNILGYSYCMKRFFDEKIYGNILLFDVDACMLQKHLSLKAIHLNSFLRRLKSLKRTALKDMYEANALNKKRNEEEKERSRERILSLDFNTMQSVHIVSETKYKEERQRNSIVQIELDATKQESKLMNDIAQLNKEIVLLTKGKLGLMEQMNDIQRGYENEIIVLKEKMEQMKKGSVHVGDKKREIMMGDIALLRKRNDALKKINIELRSKNKALQVVVDEVKREKPDNCHKLEIQKLQSQLRVKDMKNAMLRKKVGDAKRLESDMSMSSIGDHDTYLYHNSASTISSGTLLMAQEVMGLSVNKKESSKPNQFLSVNPDGLTKLVSDEYDGVDDDGVDDDEPHMMIYDSDNTPQ